MPPPPPNSPSTPSTPSSPSTPNSSCAESTPLLFVSTPIGSDVASTPPSTRPSRPHVPRIVALLLLPGRLAVGALSYLSAFTLVRRHTTAPLLPVLTGGASALVSQFLLTCVLRSAYRARHAVEKEEDGHMQWLDAIQAVGKIVAKFSRGLTPPGARELNNVFLDTSLLRMLHHSCAYDNLQLAHTRPKSDDGVLIRARHYVDYAMATYGFFLLSISGLLHPNYNMLVHGAGGLDVAMHFLGLTHSHILAEHLDGEAIHVPRHFVALDEKHDAIVIAIRGTNSISDIITDLLCGNEPFAGGYAHGGMKTAAEALWQALKPTLEHAMTRYRNHSIVVTGHSLGAGVAILLTKILLMNRYNDVKCYAIAPCPVFGPMSRVDEQWSDALECFVNADDLVARLCLSSARKLALEMERVAKLALTPNERKVIVNDNDTATLQSMVTETESRSFDPRETEVEQLYIPSLRGIHWLIEEEERMESDRNLVIAPAFRASRRYSSFVMRPSYFERILVTAPCVSAHFLQSYTLAFAGLRLPGRDMPPPPPAMRNHTTPWYANELG